MKLIYESMKCCLITVLHHCTSKVSNKCDVSKFHNENTFRCCLIHQVSVKPRLVVSYPGMQEDALLEGYLSRYFSDKVTSVTIDLYTEGSLKAYFNVAFKG